MGNKNDLVKSSKILSRILRHAPDVIGLDLDRDGWININLLLKACRLHGISLSRSLIDELAAGTDKKRFEVRSGKIRATHGHSVAIDPGQAVEPPEFLYHGTIINNLDSIFKDGLKPGKRQFVHLSESADAAQKVANRHGNKIVLLQIQSGRMFRLGHNFYCTDSVWLTDYVSASFLNTDFNLKR